MNEKILKKSIKEYKKKIKLNYETLKEDIKERKDRITFYQSYDKYKLLNMTVEEMYEYIGNLWSMLIWGNKKYIIDKLISDNGFNNLKEALAKLLYKNEKIEERWDYFKKNIKGLGPATMSELLTYADPDNCILLNKSTIFAFNYLEIPAVPKYDYQFTGKKYVEICNHAKKIMFYLKEDGIDCNNLLYVDYFLWDEILPLKSSNKKDDDLIDKSSDDIKVNNKSLHNEVKDKIVTIGELLGFKSESEKKIATGAIVDAVWEASIGNMGKVIYVFEVQSNGSIDSLILNLKKAQSNPAVQAIVAVSDDNQLEKIKKEIIGVIDEKSLRLWNIDEVLMVHDYLSQAHESINSLKLVPESFK